MRRFSAGLTHDFRIAENAVVPTGEALTRAKDLFQSLGGKLKAMVTVIEGSGFATATKRAAFTFISKTTIGKMPTKVFGEIPAACEWLATEGSKQGLTCPKPTDLWQYAASLPRPSSKA
jgi:hypothetical protein